MHSSLPILVTDWGTGSPSSGRNSNKCDRSSGTRQYDDRPFFPNNWRQRKRTLGMSSGTAALPSFALNRHPPNSKRLTAFLQNLAASEDGGGGGGGADSPMRRWNDTPAAKSFPVRVAEPCEKQRGGAAAESTVASWQKAISRSGDALRLRLTARALPQSLIRPIAICSAATFDLSSAKQRVEGPHGYDNAGGDSPPTPSANTNGAEGGGGGGINGRTRTGTPSSQSPTTQTGPEMFSPLLSSSTGDALLAP